MTLALIIVACILFLIAAYPPANTHIGLLPLGLFFFSLSFVWGKV